MAAKIWNNEKKRKLCQTEYILFHFNPEGDDLLVVGRDDGYSLLAETCNLCLTAYYVVLTKN